jgi:3-oxoacyl-[acyl-carrier protein] reductase
LAREGAAVVVNYVSNDAAAIETVRTIHDSERTALAVKTDISKVDEIRRLFDETETAFGGVDIVIANGATAISLPSVG